MDISKTPCRPQVFGSPFGSPLLLALQMADEPPGSEAVQSNVGRDCSESMSMSHAESSLTW